MAILTPSWNQNAGTVYTAQMQRYYAGVLLPGSRAVDGSMIPRSGVNMTVGNLMEVTEDSPPSMNVRVASGEGVIRGSENSLQGAYPFMNDGTVVIAISAAHATLNRLDRIVARVRDSAFSGGVNNVTLEVVTGTPASSPVLPASPLNSYTIAQILVGPAVTTIPNSVITDRRTPLHDTYIVRKTGDEIVNNSTTLQNDDHLLFPMNEGDSGTRWALDGFIFYDSSTTADIKFNITVPTSAEFRGTIFGPVLGLSGTSSDANFGGVFNANPIALGGAGVGTFLVARIVGTAQCSSTPGFLRIQWAQNTLDATNTRITVNSWIRGTRL